MKRTFKLPKARLITAQTGLFFLLLCFSCEEEVARVPDVPVNILLTLDNPEFFDLQPVNGYIFYPGGYNGLLVYHRTQDDYVAFDRACTFDPTNKGCERVTVDQSRLVAIDSCCGSEFQLFDGSVLKGPAEFPLKQYQTSYDGQSLYIVN